ncbi:hypothetical protein FHG87_020718 [Trinorchestia longiramus]|nr:hypothetical protein FHG87_020718 [Trinorchestia longiramus]
MGIQCRIEAMSDQLKMLSAIVDGDPETSIPEADAKNPSDGIQSNLTRKPIENNEVQINDCVEKYLVPETEVVVSSAADAGTQPCFSQKMIQNCTVQMNDQNNNNSVRFGSHVKCLSASDPNQDDSQRAGNESGFECIAGHQTANLGLQITPQVSNEIQDSLCLESEGFQSINSSQEQSGTASNNLSARAPFHLGTSQAEETLQNLPGNQIFRGPSHPLNSSHEKHEHEQLEPYDPNGNCPISSSYPPPSNKLPSPNQPPMYSLSLNVNTTSMSRSPLTSSSSEEEEEGANLYSDGDIDEVVDQDSLDGDQVGGRHSTESTSVHQWPVSEKNQYCTISSDTNSFHLSNTVQKDLKVHDLYTKTGENSTCQQDILQPPEEFSSPVTSPVVAKLQEKDTKISSISQTPLPVGNELLRTSSQTAKTLESATQLHEKQEFPSLEDRATASLGCPTSASLGCPTSASLGCPTSASLGCPTSASLGCPTSASLGCPTSASLGCSTSASLGCPTSASFGCPTSASLGCPTPPSPTPSLAPPPLPTSPPPMLESSSNGIIEILSVGTKANISPIGILHETQRLDDKERLCVNDGNIESLFNEEYEGEGKNVGPCVLMSEMRENLLSGDTEMLHVCNNEFDAASLRTFNPNADCHTSKITENTKETSCLPLASKSKLKLPSKIQNEARVMKMIPKSQNNSVLVQPNLKTQNAVAVQKSKMHKAQSTLNTKTSSKMTVTKSSSLSKRGLYVNKYFDGDKKEESSLSNNAEQNKARSHTESKIPKLSSSRESLLGEIVLAEQKLKLSIPSHSKTNSDLGTLNSKTTASSKSNPEQPTASFSSGISKSFHSANKSRCVNTNLALASDSNDRTVRNVQENHINVNGCDVLRDIQSRGTREDVNEHISTFELSNDCESSLTSSNSHVIIGTHINTPPSAPDLINSHIEQLETTVADSLTESFDPDSLMIIDESLESTSRQRKETFSSQNEFSDTALDFPVVDSELCSHPSLTSSFSSSRLSSGSLFSRSFKTYAPCGRNRNRSSSKNVSNVELVDFDMEDEFCDVSKIPRADPDGSEDVNLNCKTNQNPSLAPLSCQTGGQDEDILLGETKEISHDLQIKLQRIRNTLAQNQLTLEDFASESLRLKFYSLEKLASSLMLATLEHTEQRNVKDGDDFSENDNLTIEAVNEALLKVHNKSKSVRFDSTVGSVRVPVPDESSSSSWKQSIHVTKSQKSLPGELKKRTNSQPDGGELKSLPVTSVTKLIQSPRNEAGDSQTLAQFCDQNANETLETNKNHIVNKQALPVPKNRTVLPSACSANSFKTTPQNERQGLLEWRANDKANHTQAVNLKGDGNLTQQIHKNKLKQSSSTGKANLSQRANTKNGCANSPMCSDQRLSLGDRSHSLNGHSFEMTRSSVKPSSHQSANKLPASSGSVCYSSESFSGTWRAQPEEPKAHKVPITEKLISSIGKKTGRQKKVNIGVEADCSIVVSAHTTFREALIM